MENYDPYLIYLAKKGGISKTVELSTNKACKELNTSQQTISRRLILLEKKRYIQRYASTKGIRIRITEEGKQNLLKLYGSLGKIFSQGSRSLTGTLVSGLKEGAYYVSLRGYLDQFKKKLSIDPFKGTLNVKLNYEELADFLASLRPIEIKGFSMQNRTFGSLLAYKVLVENSPSAIIIPKRTSHPKNTIEIISKVNFRDMFALHDGDSLEIKEDSK